MNVKRSRSFHVILLLKDGIKLDGIIQDINDEGVLVLVVEDVFKNHLKIHLIDKIICIEDINLDFSICSFSCNLYNAVFILYSIFLFNI